MTLQEIINTLEPLVADFDPGYYYWITANPSLERENDIRLAGSSGSGECYCEDCAEKEIEKMEALDPDGEYFMEGGQYYGAELSDGFEFCSKCDRPLWVTLTTEGARSGLEGFKHWVGNLHADPQSCDEFIKICEAILQEDDGKERAKLEERAMTIYHQMQQLMDLYEVVSPSKGLNIWGLRNKQDNHYLSVQAPYPQGDTPHAMDRLFVNEVGRIFGIDRQEWQFKNTHPHFVETEMYRLADVKGVGQPADEPLTHQEFLVAIACFALADGKPGVPFSSCDIIPFLNATGLNKMPVEEAKEVGDAIIRNAHYRQAMVRKLRESQPVN
jgi:hypothetical protein